MMRTLADDASKRVAYIEARERALIEESGGRLTFAVAGCRFEAIGSRAWLAYMTLWVALFDAMGR
jgi:hypothetical protein